MPKKSSSYYKNTRRQKRTSRKKSRLRRRVRARRDRKRRNSYGKRTISKLKKLSYSDLRNLSSTELNKYAKSLKIYPCGVCDPYTDKELINILRKY